MNSRQQLEAAIDEAHAALHEAIEAGLPSPDERAAGPLAAIYRAVSQAHEILHAAGAGTERVDCGTGHPELAQAVEWYRERAEMMKLPCGHAFEDLIGGTGAVTKCGACLSERQAAKEPTS